MTNEPVRLVSLLNTAIGATIGILVLTETISSELGGALTIALAAWIAVAAEALQRPKVTPNGTVDVLVAEALATPPPKK